jgi:hypothetical protein
MIGLIYAPAWVVGLWLIAVVVWWCVRAILDRG